MEMFISFGNLEFFFFFSSVDLIARKYNKSILGVSFILGLHVGDFLLAKYWETFTKISCVSMLISIWTEDSDVSR